MPGFMMAKEIERIRSVTDDALDSLISEHAPTFRKEEKVRPSGRLEEQREAMALGHNRRVRALIEAVGRDEAVRSGRETLFRTGLDLGRDAKRRLGVNDSREDLYRAAGVLYRILGIEFTVMGGPAGEMMEVTRCVLSRHYSPEACIILSAVDEGAVSGLNPGVRMRFRERITDGSPRCLAMIEIGEGL
jgi:hypothetical protein